ncbi:MAG: response regulator transcription factor [Rhodothermaceae bacterium]|nr:response regulator transcription factor [Rhodothermaceae bacterium]
MTKIYLVDDHPLMRKGIAMTLDLEMDFEVCGQAESAEEAISDIPAKMPDIVVIDISLPGMNGIELIKHLKTQNPDLLMLVVSRHDEEMYAERAIKAGARGYLMKMEAGDVIVNAIRRILRGQIYLSEEINNKLLMGMMAGGQVGRSSPLEILSDRELEVFELIGNGTTTREIAERMHVSVKTVESYRTRIKTKLDISTGNELIKHAVQWVASESDTD